MQINININWWTLKYILAVVLSILGGVFCTSVLGVTDPNVVVILTTGMSFNFFLIQVILIDLNKASNKLYEKKRIERWYEKYKKTFQ